MKYVIDSYAWLEYFMGTRSGEKAKSVIDRPEAERFTPTICIAEVYAKVLKNESEDMAETRRDFIRRMSAIVPLSEIIAVQAAKIDVPQKRAIEGWGLADSIVLATAKSKGCKVLTGDKHFEGLEDVELI
ncbi:MAG: type II toxin-antitoxin system VapC family toxin [Nitrososphaerales archaeon]